MTITLAFLFDNDGVLIDSTEWHYRAWQALGQRGELALNKEQFLSTFGKRNDLLLKELVPNSTPHQRQKWAEHKEAIFRELACGKIELLTGMEDFLRTLKARNIPRIIASSTPLANLEMYIQTTVLGNYFDLYVSAEEVAHGKPFPDIFVEAARRLKRLAKECIVIEDAQAGIDAGKAAGAFVIALETTYPKEALHNYDLIYKSPKELNLETIEQAFLKWRKK